MDKLKSLGTPIARIKATHNCSKASKHDSRKDGGLHNESYVACRAEVIMTSNLWADVGLHNGAKGKVVISSIKYQVDQDRQVEFYQMQLLCNFNI